MEEQHEGLGEHSCCADVMPRLVSENISFYAKMLVRAYVFSPSFFRNLHQVSQVDY